MDDQQYMQLALELARKAMGRTSPNPMVGAVVVKNNLILGRGYHAKAGTAHAEIHALREAGEDSKGATLYVTLEPCSHYGRTPPCTKAIIEAGISRVVAAMADPNPLVAGRGFEQLRQAGIEVQYGLMEAEAERLNEVFIKYITIGKPFVVMKTAMTLDGKIAATSGDSKWVTGEEARLMVHRLRDRYDAIMVGIGTVLTDDPALTTRLPEAKGRDPIRVIVDSRARLPLESRVITQLPQRVVTDKTTNTSMAPTIIATTNLAPQAKLKALEKAGAWIMVTPAKDGQVDLAKLMEQLAAEGITGILLEGGSQLNASALETGIVDKVISFIAPKIIGGREAPGPVGGVGITKMNQAIQLSNIAVEQIGQDIIIEGYIK